MASCMPSAFSSPSVASVASTSAMTALSVISSFRQRGSSPVSSRRSARSPSTRPGCWSCLRREVDAHRRAAPASGCCCCQLATAGTPPPAPSCPIGMIRPVSSASGMNCAGETRPRVGCSQRTSASSSPISPVCERHDRLVDRRRSSPRSSARRRSVSSCEALQRAGRSCSGSKSGLRPCRSPWRGTSPGRRRAAGRSASSCAGPLQRDADAGARRTPRGR